MRKLHSASLAYSLRAGQSRMPLTRVCEVKSNREDCEFHYTAGKLLSVADIFSWDLRICLFRFTLLREVLRVARVGASARHSWDHVSPLLEAYYSRVEAAVRVANFTVSM